MVIDVALRSGIRRARNVDSRCRFPVWIRCRGSGVRFRDNFDAALGIEDSHDQAIMIAKHLSGGAGNGGLAGSLVVGSVFLHWGCRTVPDLICRTT
jgi:hypothetical protein